MRRQCTCGKCRLCWLADNTAEYSQKFDLPTPENPAKIVQTLKSPCKYMGSVIEWCSQCTDDSRHVRSCDIHDKCTRGYVSGLVQSCLTCREYAQDAPEPPIPVSMVMPGHTRQHIYRGGILQIHVARACDRACNNCTQGSNLKGPANFMSIDQFKIAVQSLSDYFGVVGIFGGNPCIHPQFGELCRILRGVIPWEQRGLWSNHPKGNGAHAAITFNPAYSNLNVHQSQEAYDEFCRDWPESIPYLKGLDTDSRHSPPFVAMRDVIPDEQERWKLIQNCDINKNWSAMIYVFRGQLRGSFCEIAAAQAMLHQDDPDYPDTGVPIVPGWWKQGQEAFEQQIRKHCHECGIPLRGYGALANSDEPTQYSATHAGIMKLRGGASEQVTDLLQLGRPLKRMTDYIENGRAV